MKAHWRELFHEVVESGLCTGCAGCIVACPQDVLGYRNDWYPEQTGEGKDVDQCVHGDGGCDVCTRACPRFRTWESEFNQELFGRERNPTEPFGIARAVLSVRANEGLTQQSAQDGGFVSSALVWGMENGWIDGALLSRPSPDRAMGSVPFLATCVEDVIDCAGSAYTYSANPLAFEEADKRGLRRVALVGMGCQASINGAVRARGLVKYSAKLALTIGLLCSKSFTYEGQRQVLQEHGVDIEDVIKVDVKGQFLAWTRDGRRHEIPLKELYPHTRAGCRLCPDFAADHADISAGGIGEDGWTLVIVRTERGEDWIRNLEREGWIMVRPGEDDATAMFLLNALSKKSRRRWPVDALPVVYEGPGIV